MMGFVASSHLTILDRLITQVKNHPLGFYLDLVLILGMRLKEFLFGEHFVRHEMDDAVPG